jgi:hypothetical protein
MEDEYLKNIWNSTDNKIDDFINTDTKSFEFKENKKIKSTLKTLLIPKLIGIVLGLAWASFMFMLIYFSVLSSAMSLGKFFFIGSVGMILLITAIGVFLYVKDIFIIRQIDLSESITFTQRKLAEIQLSIMNSVRVLWLQLPFYTTWYLNSDLIIHGSLIFYISQILLTGSTVWLVVWLFKNINNKNLNKKWVHHFMRGYGFYRARQAIDFIREIDNFKNDQTKPV